MPRTGPTSTATNLALRAAIGLRPGTVDDRRAWESGLIERYCARLSELSGQAVDIATAWDGYRRQACAASLMWTPTLCPPPTLPDMQPEATSMQMIERITAAMDDLDVLSLP